MQHITPDDRAVYAAAGFGRTVGLGKRPALVVIDVQERTIGKDVPVLDAIQAGYGPACGERAHAALPAIAGAVEHFRNNDLPVIHACVAPKKPTEDDVFQRLNPMVAQVGADGYRFHPSVSPREGEAVVPKESASAFFGTPLVRLLVQKQVDTVVLAGCTTSGCVRSSAVDAFSYNFAVCVLSDAVYDRTEVSHEVGLFELGQKYADIMRLEDLIAAVPQKASVGS